MAFLLKFGHSVVGDGSAATSSSSSTVAASTSSQDIQELVESALFQLYGPEGSEPNMDIIFVHDLLLLEKDNVELPLHIETWRSQSAESVIWPKEWLPQIFPQARILTVAYDASITEGYQHGRTDLYLVAERLLSDLTLQHVGEDRPVFFVGHGYGGIIIKQFCSLAYDRANRTQGSQNYRESLHMILENIYGIFFYSTPHRGVTGLRDLVQNRDPKGKQAALLDYAEILDKNMARLNQNFEGLPYAWSTRGVGGSLATSLKLGRRIEFIDTVVGEGSARSGNFLTVDEDHGSVCRPKSEASRSYSYLVEFILDLVKENEDASSGLAADFQDFMLPPYLVGPLTKEGKQEFLKLIERYTVVGFYGAEGIGKTTLAKALFNTLHPQFQLTLFVDRVKDIKFNRDSEFEEQVWKHLCRGGKFLNIKGRKHKSSTVKGKALLVVFDDMERERELRFLETLIRTAASQSRFIVTSRHMRILDHIDGIKTIEVAPLDSKDSEQLLTSYALPSRDYVMKEWQKEYVHTTVTICQGVPLRLESAGVLVQEREDSKDVWEETGLNILQSLKEVSEDLPELLKEMTEDIDLAELLKKKTWDDLPQLLRDELPQFVKGKFQEIAEPLTRSRNSSDGPSMRRAFNELLD